jgi:hypothetical protein
MRPADAPTMPLSPRHLVPVVEPRRRPRHRPGGGPAATLAAPPPPPSFEPDSPSRALALTALQIVRRRRGPADRPAAWSLPGFAREVDLVRLHLRPVGSRRVLAASFGREAFHSGPSTAASAGGPVAVAYAIRWLELGDRVERPAFDVWVAESASGPVRLPADGDPSTPGVRAAETTIVD